MTNSRNPSSQQARQRLFSSRKMPPVVDVVRTGVVAFCLVEGTFCRAIRAFQRALPIIATVYLHLSQFTSSCLLARPTLQGRGSRRRPACR
jgi:hypothetical protein